MNKKDTYFRRISKRNRKSINKSTLLDLTNSKKSSLGKNRKQIMVLNKYYNKNRKHY